MLRAKYAVSLVLMLAAAACGSGGSATAIPTSTPSVTLTAPSSAATPTTSNGSTPTLPERNGHVVILVHGWFGMPRELLPMKAFLDNHGFRTFIAILPGEDNVANANYLHDFVNEVKGLTGVAQVDTVGFSMGGLSLRYYIRFLDGEQNVRRYVSIDTPQYGDPAACLLAVEFGGQMCPGSPFLIELNQGDDTPGSVSYTTILNQEGDLAASRLHGGASEVMVSAPHGELLTSTDVFEAVRAALSQ